MCSKICREFSSKGTSIQIKDSIKRNLGFQSRTYSFDKSISNNSDYLCGIFPQLTTPFKHLKDETISWKYLEQNVIRLNTSHTFSGFVVNGFYGEDSYLTLMERSEVVRVVKKIVGQNKTVIVNSMSNSLKKTTETCELMGQSGADYILLDPPQCYKMEFSYSNFLKYYTKIADKSSLPIIINSLPSMNSIDFSAELCLDLAEHPNIVGLQESSNNIGKIFSICDETKKNSLDFTVLAGSAYFLLEALKAGAAGGITSLANILGKQIIDLYNFHKADKTSSGQNVLNLEKAKALQDSLINPDLIISSYGVPALKAALDANGYYGGPCRLPLQELSEKNLDQVREIFETNNLPWHTQENSSIFSNRIYNRSTI